MPGQISDSYQGPDGGYDPACQELAEHFLQDEPCRNDPALFKRQSVELARHIQQAVEDWFLAPSND
jgi:hypothetical protein